MKNRIVHFEIHASDTDRAMQFYGDIFGWQFVDAKMGIPYWLIMTAEQGSSEPGINGGLLKRNAPVPAAGNGPNAFVCTVDVGNFDEIHEKIMNAGGIIAMEKTAMPGMAWIGYYIDLEGNLFGVFQEDKQAK